MTRFTISDTQASSPNCNAAPAPYNPIPNISVEEAAFDRFLGMYDITSDKPRFQQILLSHVEGKPSVDLFNGVSRSWVSSQNIVITLGTYYMKLVSQGLDKNFTVFVLESGDSSRRKIVLEFEQSVSEGQEHDDPVIRAEMSKKWAGRYQGDGVFTQILSTGELVFKRAAGIHFVNAYDTGAGRGNVGSTSPEQIVLNSQTEFAFSFSLRPEKPAPLNRSAWGVFAGSSFIAVESQAQSVEDFLRLAGYLISQSRQLITPSDIGPEIAQFKEMLLYLEQVAQAAQAAPTIYPKYDFDTPLGAQLSGDDLNAFHDYAAAVSKIARYEWERIEHIERGTQQNTSLMLLPSDVYASELDKVSTIRQEGEKFVFSYASLNFNYSFATEEDASSERRFLMDQIHISINKAHMSALEVKLSSLLKPESVHTMDPVLITLIVVVSVAYLASQVMLCVMRPRRSLPDPGHVISAPMSLLDWLRSPAATIYYQPNQIMAFINYLVSFSGRRPQVYTNRDMLQHVALVMGQLAINVLELVTPGQLARYTNFAALLHTHSDGAPYLQLAINGLEMLSFGNSEHQNIMISVIQTIEAEIPQLPIFIAVQDITTGSQIQYLTTTEALHHLFQTGRSNLRLAENARQARLQRPEGLVIYGICQHRDLARDFGEGCSQSVSRSWAHSETRLSTSIEESRFTSDPIQPICITSSNNICQNLCAQILRSGGFTPPNRNDADFPAQLNDILSDDIVDPSRPLQYRMMIVAAVFYALFGPQPM